MAWGKAYWERQDTLTAYHRYRYTSTYCTVLIVSPARRLIGAEISDPLCLWTVELRRGAVIADIADIAESKGR